MYTTARATLGVWLLLAPGLAGAGDGAIEINQAAALAGTVTPTDAPGFPVTLDAPGQYRLTGNLLLGPLDLGAAIEIDADDVLLDLGGFGIQGTAECSGTPPFLTCPIPASAGGVESSAQSERVVVRNGSLRGVGLGVFLRGDGSRVEQLSVRRGSSSAVVLTGAGAAVRDVDAVLNAGLGISVGLDARVESCSLIANQGGGIQTGFNALVAENIVTANGDPAAISVAQGSRVSGNTVADNGGLGLDLQSGVGYGGNVFDSNNGGNGATQVESGGIQLGANVCAGALCP